MPFCAKDSSGNMTYTIEFHALYSRGRKTRISMFLKQFCLQIMLSASERALEQLQRGLQRGPDQQPGKLARPDPNHRLLAYTNRARRTARQTLLTATMSLESFMPARCWIAPEMPTAIYSSGATTLPVWPTCNELSA